MLIYSYKPNLFYVLVATVVSAFISVGSGFLGIWAFQEIFSSAKPTFFLVCGLITAFCSSVVYGIVVILGIYRFFVCVFVRQMLEVSSEHVLIPNFYVFKPDTVISMSSVLTVKEVNHKRYIELQIVSAFGLFRILDSHLPEKSDLQNISCYINSVVSENRKKSRNHDQQTPF